MVSAPQRRAAGIPNAQYGFGTELFKYFVFDDPDWDYTQYGFSTWKEDVAETAAILNATDTDLSAFRDSGGKIIYWTGWSDLALAPLGTIDYYERLEAGDPAARDYARLYMLPGVLHCAGGPGPDRVDWVEAIRAVGGGRPRARASAGVEAESGRTAGDDAAAVPVPAGRGLRRGRRPKRRCELRVLGAVDSTARPDSAQARSSSGWRTRAYSSLRCATRPVLSPICSRCTFSLSSIVRNRLVIGVPSA